MKIAKLAWFAALALTVASSSVVHADSVNIAASRDNTLYEENDNSNGAGLYFFVGRTGNTGGNSQRRSFIAFDIAGAIPAGSTIDNVQLRLHMSRTGSGAVDTDVTLHRASSDWGEAGSIGNNNEGQGAAAMAGDATWIYNFFNTSQWTSPGGDADSSASATALIAGVNFYFWSTAPMTTDVQGWLDNPSTNYGWGVRADAAPSATVKRFDSKDNPDGAITPVLFVTFTPVGAPGACCDTLGACTVSANISSCSGDYQGIGTMCSPNPCPQPTGACCIPDASATCMEITDADCTTANGTWQGALSMCMSGLCPVVLTPFVDPLVKPPVAQPTTGTVGGVADYSIAAKQFTQKLHRDMPPTTVWGYDDGTTGGTMPGPTIEVSSNEAVNVTWANDLRENGTLRTTHILPVDQCIHGAAQNDPRLVVHLHGGHVASAFDGQPELTQLPGESTLYEYKNWQDAATLWYHDHALGITRLNVYMGLAGFYLIRDAAENALGLPAGDYEIPLALMDRTFNPDGSIAYPTAWQSTFFGDTNLVNGVVWPFLNVDQGKYRFRVLGASGSRVYRLSLSNGATFEQIGSDGGLLRSPVTGSEILVSPGERVDIVIDFSSYAPGTEIILLNDAPAPYPGPAGDGVVPNVMKFIVSANAGHTAPLPTTLRTIVPIPETDAIEARDFELSRRSDPCAGETWLINGLGWNDITERPQLGTTETWRFINRTGMAHPMHIHLVFFQILDRQPFEIVNGAPVANGPAVPPTPGEAGWKDTVTVEPMEMVRVIAKFEDFVGTFPYHCHILEHEDHEMMRQFETITTCGDGARGLPIEECDDGNTVDGDGCSATCQIEVDVPGGGGGCCSVAGQAPPGAGLVTLLLGLPFAWLRRRRR